jgi:hypothetical protein
MASDRWTAATRGVTQACAANAVIDLRIQAASASVAEDGDNGSWKVTLPGANSRRPLGESDLTQVGAPDAPREQDEEAAAIAAAAYRQRREDSRRTTDTSESTSSHVL